MEPKTQPCSTLKPSGVQLLPGILRGLQHLGKEIQGVSASENTRSRFATHSIFFTVFCEKELETIMSRVVEVRESSEIDFFELPSIGFSAEKGTKDLK